MSGREGARAKVGLPAIAAMLKLRDADGAFIRNRFIFKRASPGFLAGFAGSTVKAAAAINLINSKDVVIENNTVEDTTLLVRKDEASTTVERAIR